MARLPSFSYFRRQDSSAIPASLDIPTLAPSGTAIAEPSESIDPAKSLATATPSELLSSPSEAAPTPSEATSTPSPTPAPTTTEVQVISSSSPSRLSTDYRSEITSSRTSLSTSFISTPTPPPASTSNNQAVSTAIPSSTKNSSRNYQNQTFTFNGTNIPSFISSSASLSFSTEDTAQSLATVQPSTTNIPDNSNVAWPIRTPPHLLYICVFIVVGFCVLGIMVAGGMLFWGKRRRQAQACALENDTAGSDFGDHGVYHESELDPAHYKEPHPDPFKYSNNNFLLKSIEKPETEESSIHMKSWENHSSPLPGNSVSAEKHKLVYQPGPTWPEYISDLGVANANMAGHNGVHFGDELATREQQEVFLFENPKNSQHITNDEDSTYDERLNTAATDFRVAVFDEIPLSYSKNQEGVLSDPAGTAKESLTAENGFQTSFPESNSIYEGRSVLKANNVQEPEMSSSRNQMGISLLPARMADPFEDDHSRTESLSLYHPTENDSVCSAELPGKRLETGSEPSYGIHQSDPKRRPHNLSIASFPTTVAEFDTYSPTSPYSTQFEMQEPGLGGRGANSDHRDTMTPEEWEQYVMHVGERETPLDPAIRGTMTMEEWTQYVEQGSGPNLHFDIPNRVTMVMQPQNHALISQSSPFQDSESGERQTTTGEDSGRPIIQQSGSAQGLGESNRDTMASDQWSHYTNNLPNYGAHQDVYISRTPAHLSMAATVESDSDHENQSRASSARVWFGEDTDFDETDDGSSDGTERG